MPKTYIRKDTGEAFTIYNPSEKSQKYAYDLRVGVDSVSGKKLTTAKKAWRSGYLQARKDNAKAYKAKVKARNYAKRQEMYNKIFLG